MPITTWTDDEERNELHYIQVALLAVTNINLATSFERRTLDRHVISLHATVAFLIVTEMLGF